MLETDRFILKLLDEQDEYEIVEWRNRKEIIDSFFSYKGVTISEHRNWYTSYLKDNTRIEFVISRKEDNKKIGTIGLSRIDHRNQKAEYGILISEKQEYGKGYAQEVSAAVIQYAFSELNLQKIKLNVFTDNMGAIKLYKKLGFKEEGMLHKEIYKNASFKDVMVMAIFKEEWPANV
jgi:UDP-4-amino-4,6-dideoxy-N-acetyl-beta-L-altrosamine N-acetyltransferase